MRYKLLAQARIKRAKEQREQRAKENRIKELKNLVKEDKVYLEKCKKYNESPSFVDGVDASFSSDIDVSAKTVNGKVFLNDKLFDEDIEKQARYLLHETIHCMQQKAGKVSGKVDKEDYLDDPNEQEAFKAQIKFQCEHEDAEEIQEYIETLLDHHGKEGEERDEIAKKLVEDL